MTSPSVRTLRYARAWTTGAYRYRESDVVVTRDGLDVPATIVRPVGDPDPPSWVVLHGITRPGRAHAQLLRFTRSIATAGIATIVPDVPEWRDLQLRPDMSAPTVAAGLEGLRAAGLSRDRPVGVIGFSFGAPHAIAAVGQPALAGQVGGVAGFGGYLHLESTFTFMMYGRHTHDGVPHQIQPDPYGRWIVAANILTAIPGCEDAGDVASALHSLGAHSGDVGKVASDPIYDSFIRATRERVAPERRAMFDQFATPSTEARPEPDRDWPTLLANAARFLDPRIDASDQLGHTPCPVTLMHGYRDNLIPCSEAQRIADAVGRPDTSVTVTRLLGHSAQERFRIGETLRDLPRFTRSLARVLSMV
ncbi:MAG: hypothetical protein AAF389_05870 [Gemmatimonadota bacterium]